jgi:nucleotide-binding universal stress UspA family protein
MAGELRILLGDDGTYVSQTARRAALDLSFHWGASLTILVAGGAAITDAVALRSQCQEMSIECAIEVAQGEPAHEILDAAGRLRPNLIILGSHRRHSFRQTGGSVGRAVLIEAQAPVLLVRERTWPPERVVVGDDSSDEARAAADMATEIAGIFGASTLLVESVSTRRRGWSARRKLAREAARVASDAELVGRRTRRPATALLSSTPPATALRETAMDAMNGATVLVAVGSSGKTEFERNMGWSVSARMVEMNNASILVVPRTWAQQPEQAITGPEG